MNCSSGNTIAPSSFNLDNGWQSMGHFTVPRNNGLYSFDLSEFFDNSFDTTCLLNKDNCQIRTQNQCDCEIGADASDPDPNNCSSCTIYWNADQTSFTIDSSNKCTERVCIYCHQERSMINKLKVQNAVFNEQSPYPLAHQVYDYDSTASPAQNAISTWEDLVNGNGHVYDRNIHCELREQGCGSVFSNTHHVFFQQVGDDWKINAVKDVVNGYAYHLCVHCEFQIQTYLGRKVLVPSKTVQYDNWTVGQRADPLVADDCSSALMPVIWNSGGWYCYKRYDPAVVLNQNGISDFFTYNDTSISTTCPISLCTVHRNADCSGTANAYPDTIQMSSDLDGWQVNFDPVNSLDEDWCVKCYVGNGGEEVINHIGFHKTSQNLLTDLSTKYQDTTVHYANDVSQHEQTDSYSKFFVNAAESGTNCRPTQCEILDGNCASSTTPSTAHILMESNYPFEIKYYKNVPLGYSYNLCVKCSYTSQSPQGAEIYTREVTDQWRFTQIRDCTGILTPHTSNWTKTDTIYLNNQNSETILGPDGWHNFFENADETNCPVDSCELRYSTDNTICDQVLDSQYGEISSTNPWLVTAYQNVSITLNYPWCVRCYLQSGLYYGNIIGKVETHKTLLSVKSTPFEDKTLLIDTSISTAQVLSTDYLSFFDNSCSTCTPQRCGIFEIDGSNACTSTPLDSSVGGGSNNLIMTNTGELSAFINEAAGWQFEFCVQCEYDTTVTDDSSAIHVLQTQVVQDIVKITLVDLDCSNTLTDPPQPVDKVLAYQAGTNVLINPNPSEPAGSNNVKWNQYFSNTKSTLCQISTCGLFDSATCTTPASGNVQILNGATIKVQAFLGEVAGYEETYCIKCQNWQLTDSAQLIWTIKQTKSICYGVFDAPSINLETVIDFNQDSSWFLIWPENFTSWDDFSGNQQPINCPVTSCQLFEQGFGSLYTNSTRIFINSTGYVFVNRNVESFQETVAIQCTNGIDSFNYDNWTIELVGCENSMTSFPDPPSPITIKEQQLGDAVIFPDGRNSTWDTYFAIGNPECVIEKCVLDGPTRGDPNSGTVNFCALENGSCICPIGSYVFFGQYTGISQINRLLDTSQTFVSKLSNSVATSCDIATFGDPAPGLTKNCFCQIGLQITNDNIQIDSSHPFQLRALLNQSQGYTETFGVACKNIADQWAFTQFWNVTLCGGESVILPGQNYFSPPFSLNSVQNTIGLQDYIGFFQSSNEDCPIESYRLLEKDLDGDYQTSQSTTILMNSDFSIQIDTSLLLNEVLYIEASTLNSENVGYLELRIFLTNFAPFFQDGVPEQQQIEILQTEESEPPFFQIPPFIDQESLSQEDITLEVSNLNETFMIFDNETNQILFPSLSEANEGNYTITITLQDLQGKTSSYEIQFEFIVPEVEEEEQEEDDDEEDTSAQFTSNFFVPITIQENVTEEVEVEEAPEDEVSPEICKAVILQIGFFGQVQIHFSQYMFTDFDLSEINEDALDIYVEPAEDRHLQNSEGQQFDISSLNLTWTPHSFKGKDLVINVTFKNPRAISPLTEQDLLMVHFKNFTLQHFQPQRQLFFAQEIKKPIDDSFRLLKRKIKRQMEDSEASRNFAESTETSKDGLLAAMAITLVLQLFMAGAMTFMIGWINSLQIIIHLPMIKILIPSNVSMFFQTIIPVVTFDIIPPERSTKLIMEFDEFPAESFKKKFDDKFFGQMQDLGYDSHNSVQILGSLWVFTALYYSRLLIFLPIVKLLSLYFKSLQKYAKRLYQRLVIGEIVLISLEAYFEFLIGGYMNILFALDSASGERMGLYSGYYSIAVSCIILPSFMIFILVQSSDKLKEPSFEKHWGLLYEGIKVKSKWQVACNLIFMMRRMIFVSMCFNLDFIPGIQIILINLLNLASCIYYGKVRPFNTRFQNFLHYFNEFLITVTTWHMMLFTDFVPNQDIQFLLGWSMIFCIMFNALINIIIILGIVGKQLFLIILKYSRILDLSYDHFCLRMLRKIQEQQVPSDGNQFQEDPIDKEEEYKNNLRKINPLLYQTEFELSNDSEEYVPKRRYKRDEHPYVVEQRRLRTQILIATNAIKDEDYVKKKRYKRDEYVTAQQEIKNTPVRHMNQKQNFLDPASMQSYTMKKRYNRNEHPYVIELRRKTLSAIESRNFHEEMRKEKPRMKKYLNQPPYKMKKRYINPRRVWNRERSERQSEFTFNEISLTNIQQ